MTKTFAERFCFLIYQTPPEYEKGIAPCSYRQRSSNIYLVNVLLNNRSSLIILGGLHVILYLPFQPACQPHSIGRLHAHMQNTIGGHRAAAQLWASVYAYAYTETQHAVKYSNAEMGVLSVVQCITVKCYKGVILILHIQQSPHLLLYNRLENNCLSCK